MVTRGTAQRFTMIKRAIVQYVAQVHENRELVIVVDHPPKRDLKRLIRHIQDLSRSDVRLVVPPAGKYLTLGALRNLSIDKARGKIICQWDDDDFHHPERVSTQLKVLLEKGKGGVYLQDVLHFCTETKVLYWAEWGRTNIGCHPATLLAYSHPKVRYPTRGPLAKRGEDCTFLLKMAKHAGLYGLAGQPHLYVYVFHGTNTWTTDHYWEQFRLARPVRLTSRGKRDLRSQLSAAGLNLAGMKMVTEPGRCPCLILGSAKGNLQKLVSLGT